MNGRTVLIVEDDNDIRENCSEILIVSGYQVALACNGLEGISKALEVLPAIIMSDLLMPEMNGLEMLDVLKSNPITSTIPFILASGVRDFGDKKVTSYQGIDGHLPKPFGAEDLITMIETVITRSVYNKSS